MPGKTTNSLRNPGRGFKRGRFWGVILVSAGLIATTSCTQDPDPEPVSNPVKLLQSVHVGLSPAAGVQTVEGTTISVSAEGESSAEDKQYDAAEVVGELPVRVSVQYRAGDKSGSDLADLRGHTGPVEINLTVENLTVKPQVIDFDAAGQNRSETALVGAPLTIAASTELPGVRVDDVTPGAADRVSGTNGVLSRTGDGAAVVQWATMLAPPGSGASTTLRLAADVKDFQVPTFDIAVQPGLNTDMSTEGVLASAFSSGTGSEMDLQLRTISLVSDVNTVLTKAGSTITEVRRNLEETSQTLGVKTAGELSDNSEALAATMADLKGQLTSLGSDLQTATETTQSSTMSQLQQTVSAVDSMLGDTSAVPPTAPIDGAGCAAEVAKPQPGATVYSSILTMASQLDAYATVSADCRNAVVAELQAAIGPKSPTGEACQAETRGDGGPEEDTTPRASITCVLASSQDAITTTLAGLVNEGKAAVAELERLDLKGVSEDQNAAIDELRQVSDDLQRIQDGPEATEEYKDALESVYIAIGTAQTSLETTRQAAATARTSINGLRQQLQKTADTAAEAQGKLDNGSPFSGSLKEQNLQLAEELCGLMDRNNPENPRDGRLSAERVEELRSYLTDIPCNPKNDDGTDAPPLERPFGFPEPQSARLDEQSDLWNTVLEQADTTVTDQAISRAFDALDASIEDVDSKLGTIDAAVRTLDGTATEDVQGQKRGLEKLAVQLDGAINSSEDIRTKLTALQKQRDELGKTIAGSFNDAADDTSITDELKAQEGRIVGIGSLSSQNVTTAFNRSISGLKSTSDDVVKDAKGTVTKQRNELHEETDALAGSLAKGTESALANIASSTTGSTRDVEGARALLSSSLNKVMLDLGDRSVNGSGLLGSMATSAAKADTADYQLALAAQNAEGYANIRSQDVVGLLLRQAQFKASLTAVEQMPPFHLTVPEGATSQTLYTLSIGGGE